MFSTTDELTVGKLVTSGDDEDNGGRILINVFSLSWYVSAVVNVAIAINLVVLIILM